MPIPVAQHKLATLITKLLSQILDSCEWERRNLTSFCRVCSDWLDHARKALYTNVVITGCRKACVLALYGYSPFSGYSHPVKTYLRHLDISIPFREGPIVLGAVAMCIKAFDLESLTIRGVAAKAFSPLPVETYVSHSLRSLTLIYAERDTGETNSSQDTEPFPALLLSYEHISRMIPNLTSLTLEGLPFQRGPLPQDPTGPFERCKLTSLHFRYVDWERENENFLSKKGLWNHLQDLTIWHEDEEEVNYTVRRFLLDGMPALRIFSVNIPDVNQKERPLNLEGLFTLSAQTLSILKPFETVRGVSLANYSLDYRRLTHIAKLFPCAILLEILGQRTTVTASDWMKFIENEKMMPKLLALDLPGGNYPSPSRDFFQVWGLMAREALRTTSVKRRITLSLHSKLLLQLAKVPKKWMSHNNLPVAKRMLEQPKLWNKLIEELQKINAHR